MLTAEGVTGAESITLPVWGVVLILGSEEILYRPSVARCNCGLQLCQKLRIIIRGLGLLDRSARALTECT